MITALDRNTALILIDLQNNVVSMPTAHPIKDILSNVNMLIQAFRDKGLPIVVVNVKPRGAAWTKARKEAKQTVLPDDENLFRISPQVQVKEDDLRITKHTWNAFFETSLQDELKKRSVTGIVLSGVSTSIGVEGTARAASELGYNITFATDAMTDLQGEAHQRSIKYIFPRMGETGTTSEIIDLLAKSD